MVLGCLIPRKSLTLAELDGSILVNTFFASLVYSWASRQDVDRLQRDESTSGTGLFTKPPDSSPAEDLHQEIVSIDSELEPNGDSTSRGRMVAEFDKYCFSSRCKERLVRLAASAPSDIGGDVATLFVGPEHVRLNIHDRRLRIRTACLMLHHGLT